MKEQSDFIFLDCKVCGKRRKFLADTQRAKTGICGECWDWTDEQKGKI